MRKIIIGILVVFSLLLAACGSMNSSKSDNWRVTVNSAKFEKDVKTNFSGYGWNSMNGLLIDLKVEYVGDNGKIMTPAISLKRISDGSIYQVAFYSIDLGDDPGKNFLWGGDEKEIELKKGDIITDKACRLLFNIPESKEEFELIVGDVPPIKIKP